METTTESLLARVQIFGRGDQAGERKADKETEADGCTTLESTEGPLTVLSLWLSTD